MTYHKKKRSAFDELLDNNYISQESDDEDFSGGNNLLLDDNYGIITDTVFRNLGYYLMSDNYIINNNKRDYIGDSFEVRHKILHEKF